MQCSHGAPKSQPRQTAHSVSPLDKPHILLLRKQHRDFPAFLNHSTATPSLVYRPKPGQKGPLEPHAVALIGYNLTGQYYLARNSWGPTGGQNGNFKVAFGAAGTLTPGETFGVSFAPKAPRPLVARPAAGRPGCKEYRAVGGDYVSGIAWRARVDLMRFIADNVAVIGDLDRPLTGKTLVICGSAAARDPLAAQLDALNGIIRSPNVKKGIDGAAGGYCSWEGVGCDAAKNVASLRLAHPAVLSLPTATLLLQLPWLTTLAINGDEGSLASTLPHGEWHYLRGRGGRGST